MKTGEGLDRVESNQQSHFGECDKPGGVAGFTFFQRLWGVIVAPGTTFRDIAERPTFWGIMLIQLGLGALFAWIISPKLQEFTRITLQKAGQGMSPELLQTTLKVVAIQAIVGAVLLPVIFWLAKAGLLKLYSQFALGAGTFRQLFSVAVWAAVPSLISGAVHTVLIMMTEASKMLSVQTSLALFLPKVEANSFLFLFLAQMDFFTIWGLVLLAIGAGAVFQQSPKKVGFYLFTLWLIFALATAGLSSYFGNQV